MTRGLVAAGVLLLLVAPVLAGGGGAAGGGAPDQDRFRPPIPRGLDLYLPVPEDNPLTQAKVELGERLFFDPTLSRDQSVACGTCHIPEHAFGDTLARAVGIEGRIGDRNAPPLLNLAWAGSLFRDGRAASLEEQALHPIHTPTEMDFSLDSLESRLDPLTRRDVAEALASYLRTILAGDAPLDRYLAGDPNALSEKEREGFRVFTRRANCSACHVGPTLSDDGFHTTGVAARSGDSGRSAVTGDARDDGAFRTPTLREVARTAPYMHDGSLASLADVVDFYDQGGLPHPNRSSRIRPLGLTEGERTALLAFLRSLSGRVEAGGRSSTTDPPP